MNKTPTLWSFVGIYFNQDWPEDYGTEDASVDAFLADAPSERAALVNEIEWVLEHFSSEQELADYVDEQGGEYLPPAEDGGYRGWLTRIADRVSATTGQR
ncbi:contact-dependent growth inhibition system immunity protein [Nocardioides sp. CN2-186]|uniref:contact-dependent growth inhibition system immunity protein n=1 Tax=Nocardioides tweenelious TaxID=3156607 RepID=UPI0032B499DA